MYMIRREKEVTMYKEVNYSEDAGSGEDNT